MQLSSIQQRLQSPAAVRKEVVLALSQHVWDVSAPGPGKRHTMGGCLPATPRTPAGHSPARHCRGKVGDPLFVLFMALELTGERLFRKP